MNFKSEFQNRTDIINKWIDELLPDDNGYHKIIFESAKYSVKAGGKRIRPLLLYSVCDMLGKNPNITKHFACAVEFIHTYSLIHDDLPCMDNDDFRRGIPTNHKKYGEAIALLAGDSLLTYAFNVASNSKTDSHITIKAIKEISNAAGMNGMIGGQVIDIKGAKNFDQLKTVYEMKTGALIKLSCYLGAISADANETQLSLINQFAENIGIAFQIKDDILDIESTNDILGKPVGSDEKRGIITYVTLFGLDGAKEKLNYHTKIAKQSLSSFGKNSDFFMNLADYLLERVK